MEALLYGFKKKGKTYLDDFSVGVGDCSQF